jgi:hypothetical protein
LLFAEENLGYVTLSILYFRHIIGLSEILLLIYCIFLVLLYTFSFRVDILGGCVGGTRYSGS